MVLVIYMSHKFKVNPDNVATPLAASIGDIVSNTVLAVTAQYMYEQISKHPFIDPAFLDVAVRGILITLFILTRLNELSKSKSSSIIQIEKRSCP